MEIHDYLAKINLDNKITDKEEKAIIILQKHGMEEAFYTLVQKILKRENEIKREKEQEKFIESMIRHRKNSLINIMTKEGFSSEWIQNYVKKDLEEFENKLKRNARI